MRAFSFVWPVFLLVFSGAAQQPQRGITPARPAVPAVAANGSYYALVIGINRYQHEPALQTAVGDAKAIETLLRERYGFQTKLLLDADATRVNILNAFAQYRRALGEKDNLLIYYAGHGTRDGDKAFWLPVDSDPDSTANWIIADDITTGIRVIPARHVLIVSDSCYSGGLGRSADSSVVPADHDAAIVKMLSSRSRVLISSGRDEPVADSGAGHSVFAGALLNGLAKMNEQSFTAMGLFDQYVRESVVGGSEQVPLYQMIQNSGHDGGDFVFFPRSVASIAPAGGSLGNVNPVQAPPTPAPAAPKPVRAPSTLARKQEPEYPSDAPKPPPRDPGGAVPLTNYRTALLMLRNAPQSLTDDAVLAFAKAQISVEQSMWNFIDHGLTSKDPYGRDQPTQYQLNPKKPVFAYEWQKYIDQNPALARGALLDLFLKPDADWSFIEKEKEWDDRFDVIEDAFVFSKDQVVDKTGKGQDIEFASRRLQTTARQHLLAAAAKAPTGLWFTVMLPQADYDVQTSSMRFKKQSGSAFEASIDLLDPASAPLFERPAPNSNTQGYLLPPQARSTANYRPWYDGRSLLSGTEDVVKPGIIFRSVEDKTILSPTEGWRQNFIWIAQTFPVNLLVLGLDRQLRLETIPMDATVAEAVHPVMNNLRAQVFIDVTGSQTVDWIGPGKQIPYAMLFARVQKVKIFDRNGVVVATVDAKTLPPPTVH